MKQLLGKAALLVLVASAYIASPFVTAWMIREAVRNGDSAYLEQKIDWPSVRATLAPTIGQIALGLPAPQTGPEFEPVTRPGLWQRFKAYFGQGALNKAIDSYITPEGLPQLFAARKLYRDYLAGQPDESKLEIGARIKRAWARVKRAEFTSITTFEIDMADKHDSDRIYLGKLALEGFGWKLKELRVKVLQEAENAITKFAETSAESVTRQIGETEGGLWARAKAAARR